MQKSSSSVIIELKDNHGRVFTKREELDKICKQLRWHDQLIDQKAGLPCHVQRAINDTLTHEVAHSELSTTIQSMAKGKALGYNGIPVEFLPPLWPTFQV